MTDDDVTVSRASLDAVLARVEQLEAEVAALREPPGRPTPPPAPSEGTPIGRRRALVGLAGAAAAGAAAVVTQAQPAAADDGQAIVIGSTGNIGSQSTGLAVTGTAAPYGFGITDNGLSGFTGNTAILGHAKAQNFDVAVTGLATGFATGVRASAQSGPAFDGTAGTGSFISGYNTSTTSPAASFTNTAPGGVVVFLGGSTPLVLSPTDSSPPASTSYANLGSLRWGIDGLWACVEAGTPGTWRKVVSASTAGAFHLLPTPVRVYDSRAGTQPGQGPKTPLPAGNVARTIDCKHNGSGVPAGATGVLLTVLLANAATGNGNLTTWAADKPKPGSNTMVWGGDAGRFTALAVSALDPQARIKIDASLTTNVVLDVVGYYR